MVTGLLADSFDPNVPTRDSWTPLHLKSLAGQKALVLSLLEHGTTIDARDATGESPRIEASYKVKQAIVETLLSLRGPPPTSEEPYRYANLRSTEPHEKDHRGNRCPHSGQGHGERPRPPRRHRTTR
ncbi:ankyrin repeat protein [Ectocarpus siliculosus]|uniref:Ankyrin repeat protein n=1 Tax=Ectocarpus siliculosus TaxID=2880 RepID=D7G8R7_ECTSI|nr:ankyrin repeat protein [Ectocarpus siliculosus]|eukprot:CBJ28091.1 ankyrin repeat protein [Ectocarpus siliculosus]